MKTCGCGKLFTPKLRGNSSKMCNSCVVNRRRFSLKEKSIEYLGGKCIDCGYLKCIEALEFDHKNPNEKEFSLSGNHTLSWEKIKAELDKCELRCANCHRERHHNERIKIPKEYATVSYIETTVCKTCKNTFVHIKSDERIFCSIKCSSDNKVKIHWPGSEVLVPLIQNSSFSSVASMLGVCDNAVRKYLLRNNINPKQIRSIKNNRFNI